MFPGGLLEATKQDATRRGEGIGIAFAEFSSAVLNNGLGRYQDAAEAAARAFENPRESMAMIWPPAELVEAAVRCGLAATARDTYERLAEVTSAAGTEWALGVQARCRAGLLGGHARRLLAVGSTAVDGPMVSGEGEILSERELQVLRLLGSELSGPEIARELFVSINTLRTHTKHIFTKLDVTSRPEAVRRARDRGLL